MKSIRFEMIVLLVLMSGGLFSEAAIAADSAATTVAACPSLDPTPDGGTIPLLYISAIKPGEFIEVFNDGEIAFSLSSSTADLCSPFIYINLSILAPGTIIGPGEYAVLPWPVSFPDTESGGQVLLFNVAAGHFPENVGDFVCWGSGTGGRKSQAEAVGKWSGNCVAAISAGKSIRRLAGTSGTTLESYDAAADPQTCESVGDDVFEDGFEGISP